MRPEVILWDVMDTLVTDPFFDVMPRFFGMTLTELIEAKHPTAWVRFERAELTEAEFLRVFFADGRSYDHAAFRAEVHAAYTWIEDMQPLLAALCERGIGMHAFSNYPIWYLEVERRLRLSRYLSWTFVSCRTGLRKPDPEAYRSALQVLGCEPRACLFVDDRADNCEAARDAGMTAIRFEGDPRALARQIDAL